MTKDKGPRTTKDQGRTRNQGQRTKDTLGTDVNTSETPVP